MVRRTTEFRNVAEARARARRVLPRPLFDFIDGGADGEITLRDNTAAYEEVAFLSKAAAFPPKTDPSTTVLGTRVSMPLVLSPCGGVRLLAPDGDRSVARAASAAGVPYAMSTASRTPPEDVFDATPGPLWFQLYFHGQREEAEALIDRVQNKGFGALFVTVDSSGLTNHERLYRHRKAFPMKKSLDQGIHFAPHFASHPGWFLRFLFDGMPTTYSSLPEAATPKSGLAPATSGSAIEKGGSHPCPTWEDIDWIRRQWKGPLVVKGLMTPDDARRAADRGANGIVLSNHGGRQLDGVPGTLRMLPEVRAAVGDQLEVLIDGGIRRGGDVIKAIALGATAAMVGRPYLYGLAAAGEPGVARVLEILRTDIVRALGQLGCGSVDELDRSAVDTSRMWQPAVALTVR